MEKNFTRTNDPKYDLHLSAYSIDQKTIEKLEGFGFTRDEFANNRYCDTTAYHGTFLNWIPDNELHDEIISTLAQDETFNGGLEEEVTLPYFRKEFTFEPGFVEADEQIILALFKKAFPALKATVCPPGTLKQCDMHINVNWEYTGTRTKKAFDDLGIVSFDKPADNKEGFNRIYTLTFERLADGMHYFNQITKLFTEANGRPLHFVGKVKLEITTRIYRKPLDGILLPLILKHTF